MVKVDPSSDEPHVSVVIPVHDNAVGAQALLQALATQEGDLPCFDVVLVDNASDPPLEVDVPEALQVRIVREPRKGRGLARNAGLRAARGTIIAMIDSDCTPASNWLAAGLEALRRSPGEGPVAGRVLVTVDEGKRRTPVEIYEQYFAFNMERYVRELHYGGTGNLFVPSRVFAEVGPFDNALNAAEDAEWGVRAFQAGYATTYDGSVKIYHPARRTFKELARKQRRQMGGAVNRERANRSTDRGVKSLAKTGLRTIRRVLNALIVPILLAIGIRRSDRPHVRHIPHLLLVGYFVQFVNLAERARLAMGGQAR